MPQPGDAVTLTVTETLPRTTTRAIESGEPNDVRLRNVGDQTYLTFTPRPGRHVLVEDIARPDLFGVMLRQGSGAFGALSTSEPSTPGDLVYEYTPQPAGSLQTLRVRADNPGSTRVTVWVVDDPVTTVRGILAPGVPGVTRKLTWSPGQNPGVQFRGVAGTRPTIDVTGLTIPADQYVTYGIYGSDGNPLGFFNDITYPGSGFASCGCVLPADGSYTLRADPSMASTGSLTVTLATVQDVAVTVTPGVPVTVRLTAPGQVARLTVPVPNGGQVRYAVTGSTFPDAYLTLTAEQYGQIGFAQLPVGDSSGDFGLSPFYDNGFKLSPPSGVIELHASGKGTGTATITALVTP